AEIPVVVTSVIQPGESTDDVKPLKPQLRLPGAAPVVPPLVIQSALAVVVLAMLVLIIRQTRRAGAKRGRESDLEGDVQLTPAQRAMAELNRVATLGLPEQGRYAEHYALVGRTLPFYVRDRFALAALRGSLGARAARRRPHRDRAQLPPWASPVGWPRVPIARPSAGGNGRMAGASALDAGRAACRGDRAVHRRARATADRAGIGRVR